MDFKVIFPEGSAEGHKVNVCFGDFEVKTDQPVSYGGQNSEPAPFLIFLSSLATCSGWFLLRFLETRHLPVDGIELSMETSTDKETRMLSEIKFKLTLPESFPDKYRNAAAMAIHQCAVTRSILNPPQFVTEIKVGQETVLKKKH